MLKMWEVGVLAHADIHTDDSYQFSRAAKQAGVSARRSLMAADGR